jgi:hypothetical protein
MNAFATYRVSRDLNFGCMFKHNDSTSRFGNPRTRRYFNPQGATML